MGKPSATDSPELKWLKFERRVLSNWCSTLSTEELAAFIRLINYAWENNGYVPQETKPLCRITRQDEQFVSKFISDFDGDLIETGCAAGIAITFVLQAMTEYTAHVLQLRDRGRRGGLRSRGGLRIVDGGEADE